jgi:hypothetical protein
MSDKLARPQGPRQQQPLPAAPERLKYLVHFSTSWTKPGRLRQPRRKSGLQASRVTEEIVLPGAATVKSY